MNDNQPKPESKTLVTLREICADPLNVSGLVKKTVLRIDKMLDELDRIHGDFVHMHGSLDRIERLINDRLRSKRP